jgi:hypothetical protein
LYRAEGGSVDQVRVACARREKNAGNQSELKAN